MKMSQKVKNEPINMNEQNKEVAFEGLDNEKNDEIATIPFWSYNPNILFLSSYLFEFFPIEAMSYEQKLNAVTRSVIILTLVGFLLSRNVRTIIVGIVTIVAIFIMHFYHEKEKQKNADKKPTIDIKENFESPAVAYLNEANKQVSDDVFSGMDVSNPFNNVLMDDYKYNPNKKPAPPAFNSNVNDSILATAKQAVIDSNPGQPDIADKLFKDLGDEYVFEQSLRPFNSNPSTTIPNDQQSFADFCYGSMVSCKEGNEFACARNQTRHTNY